MRILFLVSRDWTHPQATGGDACTCDYARHMAARGHEVTLIAAHYPGSAPKEVLDGVRIVRPGGMFLLAAHALLYYRRRQRTFDAVFEEAMASVRLPFLAPLYVRKPLIAVWYQLNGRIFSEQYPWPVALALTWAERITLVAHRQCMVIALAEERRRELLARGLSPERVRVIPPLMLDLCLGTTDERPREPVIVWIGKLRRYKCAHHVVEAMPEVVRHVPEAKLVIAGRRDDEGYERELLELADRLGVGAHVQVLADVSEGEKWDLLSRARALAVTSPVEGFSIVIVEANCCGTPVVATEGVPVDTAIDGYNGFRVPFADRRALATALVRLMSDRPLFEELSANARMHALEFSAERGGARLEDAFAVAGARAA